MHKHHWDDQPWFGTAWFDSGPDPLHVDPDPSSLSGEYAITVAGDDSRWTWQFNRAP